MKTMIFLFTTLTIVNSIILIWFFLWLRALETLHDKLSRDILELVKLFKQDSGSWRAASNIHSTQIHRLEKIVLKEEEDEDNSLRNDQRG